MQENPSPGWQSTDEGQTNSALQDFPHHFQYPQPQLCWMIASRTSPQNQSNSDCFSLLPPPLVVPLFPAGQFWLFSGCEFREECHVSVASGAWQFDLGQNNLH